MAGAKGRCSACGKPGVYSAPVPVCQACRKLAPKTLHDIECAWCGKTVTRGRRRSGRAVTCSALCAGHYGAWRKHGWTDALVRVLVTEQAG